MGALENRRNSRHAAITGYGIMATLALVAFAGMALHFGVKGLYERSAHAMNGVSTNATFTGWRTTCQLQYMLKDEPGFKYRPEDCAVADALVQANPGKEVSVNRETFIKVRYALADRRVLNAEIPSVGSYFPKETPVGATIEVVYSPEDPSNVQMPFTLEVAKEYLLAIGFGIIVFGLLSIGFIIDFFRKRGTAPVELPFEEAEPEYSAGENTPYTAAPAPLQRATVSGHHPRATFGQRRR